MKKIDAHLTLSCRIGGLQEVDDAGDIFLVVNAGQDSKLNHHWRSIGWFDSHDQFTFEKDHKVLSLRMS